MNDLRHWRESPWRCELLMIHPLHPPDTWKNALDTHSLARESKHSQLGHQRFASSIQENPTQSAQIFNVSSLAVPCFLGFYCCAKTPLPKIISLRKRIISPHSFSSSSRKSGQEPKQEWGSSHWRRGHWEGAAYCPVLSTVFQAP